MVSHQSALWDLAHDGNECAAAFLAYDQNEDLLLQYGESQRWILDFGDFEAGTKNGKKKTFHRNWWTGADLHEPEFDDNDLTWYEFSQACPGVSTIGSADPPTPPYVGKTIEELAQISQDIKNENTIPNWEWTDYVYGTILPHIDELHEASALYEVTYEDADDDCLLENYTFTGFRQKSNDKKAGWGCCTNNATVNIDNSGRVCYTFIDDEMIGLFYYQFNANRFDFSEVKGYGGNGV